MVDPSKQRRRMVARQVAGRGVRDARVLAAVETVPRELFVRAADRHRAYRDRPLPIGAGQTISQPFIVAYMIEALELQGGERVLEVGAGSGYAAAVLAEIAGEVFAVERIGELAEMARRNLREAGCDRIDIKHANGAEGWPDAAPFDAILVSAGAARIPSALRTQLKIGGRLVVPVGSSPDEQQLVRVRRVSESEFAREALVEVRFVPLVEVAEADA